MLAGTAPNACFAQRSDTEAARLSLESPRDAERVRLLIDRYVPVADVSETHVLAVAAPAEAVLAAAVAFRPDDDILFRRMMALRELPMRLARVFGRTDGRPPRPFGFDDVTLLERGPREVV